MPFPQSTREVYENNPLHEVICQLRFPPILTITAEEPARFQEKIRQRYPFYQRHTGNSLPKELAEIVRNLPVANIAGKSSHWFLKDDNDPTTRITLADDFIAVSVGRGRYTRWEDLKDEIEVATSALMECYNPSVFTRTGLRYRNVIDRTALGVGDEPWENLLSPALLGLLGSPEFKSDVDSIRTEASIMIADVPDAKTKLRHGLATQEGGADLTYLIDADFYCEARRELDDVRTILDVFNELDGRLFRWAITDKLRDALSPQHLA